MSAYYSNRRNINNQDKDDNDIDYNDDFRMLPFLAR